MSTPPKFLIAYHDNCIDGFTSAWVCHKGLTEVCCLKTEEHINIELMPMTYGKLDELSKVAESYEHIYFVDFSVPVEFLESMESKVDITVIDHHKTAIDTYLEFWGKSEFRLEEQVKVVNMGELGVDNPLTIHGAEIVLDLDECGASLCWQYFFGTLVEIPLLVAYVKDYDLWRFTMADTRAMNMALMVAVKSLESWEALYSQMHNSNVVGRQRLRTEGYAILTYHESIVSDLVDQAVPCTVDGAKGLGVNCSAHFASDVGHELALLSGTYGLTWQAGSDDLIKVSLRSNGDYDVSAIAAEWGGGGHKTAAGFVVEDPNSNMTFRG